MTWGPAVYGRSLWRDIEVQEDMVFILVAGSGIYKALHLAEVPGVDTGTRWNDLWSSKDLGCTIEVIRR